MLSSLVSSRQNFRVNTLRIIRKNSSAHGKSLVIAEWRTLRAAVSYEGRRFSGALPVVPYEACPRLGLVRVQPPSTVSAVPGPNSLCILLSQDFLPREPRLNST